VFFDYITLVIHDRRFINSLRKIDISRLLKGDRFVLRWLVFVRTMLRSIVKSMDRILNTYLRIMFVLNFIFFLDRRVCFFSTFRIEVELFPCKLRCGFLFFRRVSRREDKDIRFIVFNTWCKNIDNRILLVVIFDISVVLLFIFRRTYFFYWAFLWIFLLLINIYLSSWWNDRFKSLYDLVKWIHVECFIHSSVKRVFFFIVHLVQLLVKTLFSWSQ